MVVKQMPQPPVRLVTTTAAAPQAAKPAAWPWSTFLLALAAVLLSLAQALPFWSLTLHAPQYPGGLEATIYTQQLVGDVSEIDGLNHYIGMMKLGDAARVERRLAPVAVPALALLALLAAFVGRRLRRLLALPLILFPAVFAIDLYYWLYRAGHELAANAALRNSVRPFTPAMLGRGTVGQFSTTASFELGFYLAAAASALAIMGIVGRPRRRSDRPQ